MNLCWMTDIHLNFLRETQRKRFYDEIMHHDSFLITGDIAEAGDVEDLLSEMANHLQKTIYFVAGNHDFYFGSIETMNNRLEQLGLSNKYLCYLPANDLISFKENPTLRLMGVNSFADGRFGDYQKSTVILNDSQLIEEYKHLSRSQLLQKMQYYADKDATLLRKKIVDAYNDDARMCIIAVHVPPLPENALYNNKISNDDFLPFYTSKAIADVLLRSAADYPDLEMLVLCGHSHSAAFSSPVKNLKIYTGESQYYEPQMSGIIDIKDLSFE